MMAPGEGGGDWNAGGEKLSTGELAQLVLRGLVGDF